MVVEDLGREGNFELDGCGDGPHDGGALEQLFAGGVGFAAVQVYAALNDVDVGGVVFAVEAVLIVVGVVVFSADAIAEPFHLKLGAVVLAGVAALGRLAVWGVAGGFASQMASVKVGSRRVLRLTLRSGMRLTNSRRRRNRSSPYGRAGSC